MARFSKFFLPLFAFCMLHSSLSYAGTEKSVTQVIHTAALNAQMIVEGASVFKDINSQIEERESKVRQSYVAAEEKMKKDRAALDATKDSMAPEAYKKKDDALSQEWMKTQNELQYQDNIINKARFDAYKKVQDYIVSIVAEVAAAKNIEMVVPSGFAVYATNDITDEIMTRLNNSMSALKVEFIEQ